jgi:hypothetical protein
MDLEVATTELQFRWRRWASSRFVTSHSATSALTAAFKFPQSGQQRRPFGLRIDIDGLYGVAVDAREQCRRAGRGAEIDALAVQILDRLVGSLRQHPAHLDAVFGEAFLKPPFFLQHQADGVIVSVVDPHLFKLVGLRSAADPKAIAPARRGRARSFRSFTGDIRHIL